MKIKTLCALVSLVLLPLTVSAENATEITFNDLPSIVQNTALQEVYISDITKVERIREEKATKYEIESKKNETTKDITIATNGLLLEIEKSMQFDQLPQEVISEIKKDYPSIKIKEVESVQRYYFTVNGDMEGKNIDFKVFATGDIEDENAQDETELDHEDK